MVKNRVIPIRLDKHLADRLDAEVERLKPGTIGRKATRSDVIRIAIETYFIVTDQAESRKRKGKVVCCGCGKKLFPARMAIKITDLFGQDIFTCPECVSQNTAN